MMNLINPQSKTGKKTNKRTSSTDYKWATDEIDTKKYWIIVIFFTSILLICLWFLIKNLELSSGSHFWYFALAALTIIGLIGFFKKRGEINKYLKTFNKKGAAQNRTDFKKRKFSNDWFVSKFFFVLGLLFVIFLTLFVKSVIDDFNWNYKGFPNTYKENLRPKEYDSSTLIENSNNYLLAHRPYVWNRKCDKDVEFSVDPMHNGEVFFITFAYARNPSKFVIQKCIAQNGKTICEIQNGKDPMMDGQYLVTSDRNVNLFYQSY